MKDSARLMILAAQSPGLVEPLSSPQQSFIEARPRFVGGLTTTVMSDPGAFEALRDEWDELLDDSAQRVFFLRQQWNHLWWRYYAPSGSRLNLIACRDDHGTLMGLAPLYWRQHRILNVPYARELLLLGMGIDPKSSERLDIVARRGAEQAVGEAVGEWLQRSRVWDRLWLSQVPNESVVLPHLTRALGGRLRSEVCDRAPYIDTSTDWRTFKAGFGRSMRRNIEYYPRRLLRTHPSCEFGRVNTADDLEPAMDALVRLHQARWQAQGEPGAFCFDFGFFLRDAMRDAFRTSRLVMWTLKIDGCIEATLVGFLDNGVLHYFQKGFNPAYAKEDLGTAMLALCVRDCFEDPGVRCFDFMGGGAPYKDLWARLARENVVCEMQRPTAGAVLFTVKRRLSDLLSTVYRKVAPERLRAARRARLRRLRCERAAERGLGTGPVAVR